jgi:adenine-specific DNA methylase
VILVLLYHAIHKTYDDFDEVYRYRMGGKGGTLIETDKELKQGQVIILSDINDYAIIVDKVWEENDQKYFTYISAERVVVRARVP